MSAASGGSATSAKRVFKRTQLCSFWVRGACKRGAACAFAHGESQLRETPDLSKTKICKNFQTGTCQLGELCSFAHCRDELRSLRPKRASSSVLVEVPRSTKVREGSEEVRQGGASSSSDQNAQEMKADAPVVYTVVDFESVERVCNQLMEQEAVGLDSWDAWAPAAHGTFGGLIFEL
ncbi:zfs1 [Symbiodinium natans]|uniref:Zfs1 protein n=1 Tax=Symbiodinium natans TaxID=878477 RepID=A0A812M8L9_9DINO|nr:zfs1 [Symbiodinium natans]